LCKFSRNQGGLARFDEVQHFRVGADCELSPYNAISLALAFVLPAIQTTPERVLPKHEVDRTWLLRKDVFWVALSSSIE
jgi:hypothetical protein